MCNNLVLETARPDGAAFVSSDWVGADLIRAERRRQIEGEGWDGGHDDAHRSGELCDAAISYARAAAKQARGESLAYLKGMAAAGDVPWPWEDGWWKPDADQIRNLVKAGALIAAEIDRLHRERTKAPTDLSSASTGARAASET